MNIGHRTAMKTERSYESRHLTSKLRNGNMYSARLIHQAIPPESYHLDSALLTRPGNHDIQLDLLRDYKNNVAIYHRFHEYLESSGVPVLAVWGKNDPIFIAAGAEAYKKHAKDVEVHFLDAGHFALETNELEVSKLMIGFFEKLNI